jgi:hypothetical protein
LGLLEPAGEAEKEDAGVRTGTIFTEADHLGGCGMTGTAEAELQEKRSMDTREAREMIPSGDSDSTKNWSFANRFFLESKKGQDIRRRSTGHGRSKWARAWKDTLCMCILKLYIISSRGAY